MTAHFGSRLRKNWGGLKGEPYIVCSTNCLKLLGYFKEMMLRKMHRTADIEFDARMHGDHLRKKLVEHRRTVALKFRASNFSVCEDERAPDQVPGEIETGRLY